MADTPIQVRPLEPGDWPVLSTLFGSNGACGGCWCMHWRMPKGADWDREKGARNKRAFKRLVTDGKVHGCLALDGEDPVGWCCIGPRSDFPRLLRSRVLKSDGQESDWAVVCFYVPARWRKMGVASALLKEAVAVARSLGARSIEGYPVQSKKGAGQDYPATFAFTGVPGVFRASGFRDVTPEGASRLVFRRGFRRARSAGGGK